MDKPEVLSAEEICEILCPKEHTCDCGDEERLACDDYGKGGRIALNQLAKDIEFYEARIAEARKKCDEWHEKERKKHHNWWRFFIRLFSDGYCKGCKHLYNDQYGNMCLYSSPTYSEKLPFKQVIMNDNCNLWERK